MADEHAQSQAAARERLRELLGVDVPGEDSRVWNVITALGIAVLDELQYQDARLQAVVREQAELLTAARSLLDGA